MKAFYGWEDIIGYEEEKERAKALSRLDDDILITGESGVGKRLFASAIHNESSRREKPFITIEVPSVNQNIFESELFGHKRGAFTDAREDKAGLLETANTGTVFLDEIGDLTLECQVKLLRVIEEKKLRRVGENFERDVDIRFIFATGKDLWRMAKESRFRNDLLHRIEGNVLQIPTLREKRNEFPRIVKGLWESINSEKGYESFEPLTDKELEILSEFDYPGNIRQLENILRNFLNEMRNHHFHLRSGNGREEVLKRILEEVKGRWEEEEKGLWHSYRIFKEMKEGKDFWEAVWKRYLNHEINRFQLEEIVKFGLEESGRTLKGVLPLFHIEERDYKKLHDFLRNQGIRIKKAGKRPKKE